MRRALIIVGTGLVLAAVFVVGWTQGDHRDGERHEGAGAAQPAETSMARAASTPGKPTAPLAIRRMRMRTVPDRIDPTALKRIERRDGAVGVVLPNGRVWYGIEDMPAGPEAPDVLPTLDVLDRYPTVADRFEQTLKTDALRACRTARRLRQGVVEAEIQWTMTVRASVRDGTFKVDDVSSGTWPEAFDREFYDCLAGVLAAAEWRPSDGLSEIAFEYPFSQTVPTEAVDGEDKN